MAGTRPSIEEEPYTPKPKTPVAQPAPTPHRRPVITEEPARKRPVITEEKPHTRPKIISEEEEKVEIQKNIRTGRGREKQQIEQTRNTRKQEEEKEKKERMEERKKREADHRFRKNLSVEVPKAGLHRLGTASRAMKPVGMFTNTPDFSSGFASSQIDFGSAMGSRRGRGGGARFPKMHVSGAYVDPFSGSSGSKKPKRKGGKRSGNIFRMFG